VEFTIKAPGTKAMQKHHFWILAKGENAGRPENTPRPNSFLVECRNEEEKNRLFGLTFALFTTTQFKPLLMGSVIPFLTVGSVKKLLLETVKNQKSNTQLDALLSKLHLVQEQQINVLKRLSLMRQMEEAISYQLVKGALSH